MNTFPLKIVTPDGLEFEGQVQSLTLRTVTGDLGVMAGHADCVAPLGMGRATVVIDGEKRYAACIGGMLSVSKGAVTVVATTFEWAGEIDKARADRSHERAQNVLQSKDSSDADIRLAQARLRRALVRKSVAESK